MKAAINGLKSVFDDLSPRESISWLSAFGVLAGMFFLPVGIFYFVHVIMIS